MSVEIERKFLVAGDGWRRVSIAQERLRQGYLANTPACSIRVRSARDRAWLSVKGMQPGRSRPEFEYPIPEPDAAQMLSDFAGEGGVEKIRHRVPVGSHCFEVDEFEGANAGLVIAEIELGASEESFDRPAWLGEEVTDDARFYNFRLATEPFSTWPDERRQDAMRGRRPIEDSR
jgi:adenylate cyclase